MELGSRKWPARWLARRPLGAAESFELKRGSRDGENRWRTEVQTKRNGSDHSKEVVMRPNAFHTDHLDVERKHTEFFK
ncbi:hypothetical protein GN244_ATG03617 [Phytophthora infestans]|uniref:Uncharacterized protein n=1 Tax=Phytophthora infestans TaxID=4787 RepID=A0A833X009_PHYIN|nr:hypothetical protein GN244_ATG03617 [Phytophthora infestans]KAF4132748.1 hypothetical protein GN958_ATG18046 [Phytophthora infestans]